MKVYGNDNNTVLFIISFRKALCTLFLLLFILTAGLKASAEDAAPDYSQLQPQDVIEFGKYEQDNNLENGPEPVEWIVLEIQDEKVLLISRYGLDAVQFHNCATAWNNPVNWVMSSIRKWLNHDFYEKSFSDSEKEYIASICIADDAESSGDKRTVDTEDRIFILSVDEAKQYMNKQNRACQAIPYAKSKKIWIGYDGNCWWWLRTPGEQHDYVAHIGTEGNPHIYGNRATAKDGTVRPAFWLKLKKD